MPFGLFSRNKKLKWYTLFDSQAAVEQHLPLKKILTVELGSQGQVICLVRTEEGVFAFERHCPHAGAALETGIVNDQLQVVCPLHAYCFDLKDGKEKTGNPCADLKTYPVKVEDTGLSIGLPN